MSEEAGRVRPKPKPGATELPFILRRTDEDGGGEEECVLRPTYAAARAIAKRYGGVRPAVEKVLQGDVEEIAVILAFGLGYTGPTAPQRPPKNMAQRVWATGVSDDSGGLAELAIVFLQALQNGGRVPDEQTDEPGRDDEEPGDADP